MTRRLGDFGNVKQIHFPDKEMQLDQHLSNVKVTERELSRVAQKFLDACVEHGVTKENGYAALIGVFERLAEDARNLAVLDEGNDDDASFTRADAYALGLKDGREAAERGQHLSMGMTWDTNQDFNEAYDEGVNAAQKAFVLERHPGAYVVQLPEAGIWQVWGGVGDAFPEPLAEGEAEYEAWQAAAAALGATQLAAPGTRRVTALTADTVGRELGVTQPMTSPAIGYCVTEDFETRAITVGEWTREDHDKQRIEPSNFFPEYGPAAAAVITLLNTRLQQEQAALGLACHRIADHDQTYEEANTAEGWEDVYRERAVKGERRPA